jgi:inner membrane protein involved in colicin E2 resistance
LRLKDETILAIGMMSMALGILVGRFLHFEYLGFSVTDFVKGVLVGLSLVMNITYLLLKRKGIARKT